MAYEKNKDAGEEDPVSRREQECEAGEKMGPAGGGRSVHRNTKVRKENPRGTQAEEVFDDHGGEGNKKMKGKKNSNGGHAL